jgi:hypothetical protein
MTAIALPSTISVLPDCAVVLLLGMVHDQKFAAETR